MNFYAFLDCYWADEVLQLVTVGSEHTDFISMICLA